MDGFFNGMILLCVWHKRMNSRTLLRVRWCGLQSTREKKCVGLARQFLRCGVDTDLGRIFPFKPCFVKSKLHPRCITLVGGCNLVH